MQQATTNSDREYLFPNRTVKARQVEFHGNCKSQYHETNKMIFHTPTSDNLHETKQDGKCIKRQSRSPCNSCKHKVEHPKIKQLSGAILGTCIFHTLIIIITNGCTSVTAYSQLPAKHTLPPIVTGYHFINSRPQRGEALYSTKEIETDAVDSSESPKEPPRREVQVVELHRPSVESSQFGKDDLLQKTGYSLLSQITENYNKHGGDKNGKAQAHSLNNSTAGNTNNILFRSKSWERRHAPSVEEGIRREKITTNNTGVLGKIHDSIVHIPFVSRLRKNAYKRVSPKRYGARTITGLITALAEESQGVEVEVDARSDSPFSGKQIDSLTINFSR